MLKYLIDFFAAMLLCFLLLGGAAYATIPFASQDLNIFLKIVGFLLTIVVLFMLCYGRE